MVKPTTVSVFGSTGSIGTQTLDVCRNSESFSIIALTANDNVGLLVSQAREFKPDYVALTSSDPAKHLELVEGLKNTDTEIVQAGELQQLSGISDIAVNAIVGFAGLAVTVGCLQAGKRLGLANKESLIAAGPLVQQVRQTIGAEILPIDSEHAAIHQCLNGKSASTIELTASGGPFRTRKDLTTITLAEALIHPNWDMGQKITIDSSTLMNKGLEVIEAYELFGKPAGTKLGLDRIRVVVHPQSIVHSMVTFTDGSTIAQLSEPDMRLPIVYALSYPERAEISYGEIDWSKPRTLDFEPPDLDRFRCLKLAYQAAEEGGAAPAWINAANEVAVDAFLSGTIDWIDIADVVGATLDKFGGGEADVLQEVVEQDRQARAVAFTVVRALEN